MTQVPDFWSVVLPTWISAVGGLISAVIGAIALVLSLRNRGSVRHIQDGLNAANDTEVVPAHTAGGTLQSQTTLTGTAVAVTPVTWGVERDGKHYRLVNRSNRETAKLLRAEDVSADSDGAFQILVDLPVDLGPGASLPFMIEKSIVSAPVTAVQVTWADPDGETRQVVLYV